MILEVKNLTLGYEDKKVIENMSFSLEEGDFVIIVGKNGAGKSTLIKGILGLSKIYSGEILLGSGLTRNQVGYMPQEVNVDKSFPASVYEIVLSGRINRLGLKPFYSKDDKKRALEVLDILNINDIKSKSFQELSGGQRQKVLLARSLCATDKLLILDEPSNNLDSTSKGDFYNILENLNKNYNISIMMISHDNESINLGNRILKITDNGYEYYKRGCNYGLPKRFI